MLNFRFINTIIKSLSEKRIFWSEIDFQLAFAWEIKLRLKDVEIYLERRFEFSESEVWYIDIWVEYNGGIFPIELKYKTKKCEINLFNNDKVKLKEQGACDLGRYGFIKDIFRLEKLSSIPNFKEGYAIILTNEPKYFQTYNNRPTIDRDFRIHDNHIIQGNKDLVWYSSAKWVENYPKIHLMNNYKMNWHTYIGDFKYSICIVK